MPTEGTLIGGWSYVAAAWGLSLAMLLGYAIWVNWRLRKAQSGDDAQS